MGRIYSAQFTGVTLTSATPQDAFSLKASAAGKGKLHALFLSQSVKAQDANDAQIGYQITTGATTQGSGGSTPAAVGPAGDTTTSIMTVHANDTTQASAGTIITPHSFAFNDRAGEVFIPTPFMQELLIWGVSTMLVVKILSPSQTYTSGFNGTIYWEEM
jgi:hypothetical protein